MRKAMACVIVIFINSFFQLFFQGCVTDTASLKIEKTMPQSKLAYYNDSFDKFRTDLWDKAGYIHNEAQKANFKLAKMRVEDGKALGCKPKQAVSARGDWGSKSIQSEETLTFRWIVISIFWKVITTWISR